MEMKDKLDKALTSKNAVEDFYNLYNKDLEFKTWLNKFIPEIEDCANQKQNNPWHIYNVLGHIIHSVENINNISNGFTKQEKRMLSYIMFFHDIGKPTCHAIRSKKGFLIDSFFNHNKASKCIASKYLDKLGFENNEINMMLELILKHDIFMFITIYPDNNKYHKVLTEDLIKEEIKELAKYGDGNKMMSMLLKIGRADSMAQNPAMTKDSFKLLDKFDELFNKINKTR